MFLFGDEFYIFYVYGYWWERVGVLEDTRSVGLVESWLVCWCEDVLGTWLYHCYVESHMM